MCDALIINKIDVLPYFDFDMDKVVEYAHRRNPNLKIFPISAKSGLGVDAWRQWLLEETRGLEGELTPWSRFSPSCFTRWRSAGTRCW